MEFFRTVEFGFVNSDERRNLVWIDGEESLGNSLGKFKKNAERKGSNLKVLLYQNHKTSFHRTLTVLLNPIK